MKKSDNNNLSLFSAFLLYLGLRSEGKQGQDKYTNYCQTYGLHGMCIIFRILLF